MSMFATSIMDQLSSVVPEDFLDWKWHYLTLANESGIQNIAVRRIQMEKYSHNPNSMIAKLEYYFKELDSIQKDLNNPVCRKGCSGCCSNDFEISMTEFFYILRYMNIHFSVSTIEDFQRKAQEPFHFGPCLFIDHNDEACQIYEARPLICRKYGLLDNLTDCPLLSDVPLSEKNVNTADGTFLFALFGTDKKFYVGGHPLVYWIEHTENGQLASEKMKNLYEAAFSEDERQFSKMLLL